MSGNKLFPILHTDRLDLIEITERHLDDFFAIFNNKEVTRYYNLVPFTSPEDGRQYVEVFRKGFEDNMYIRWGITLKGESHIIGTLGFNNYTLNHRAEIGYDLHREHWNKGYITEALKEIIEYGFDVLEVNRIEAEIIPENKASGRVLEKAGFSKEGLLRAWHYWNERHFDVEMYSLLKSEWKR